MFDVGFSEMLVIGIVALVVIGPERLPGVARTIGHLMGRAQRYVNDVKRDIDREMQVEELRKLQAQMQDTARSIESSVTTQVGEVKTELDKAHDTMNQFAQQTSDLTRLDDPLASAEQPGAPTTPTVDSSMAAVNPSPMLVSPSPEVASQSPEILAHAQVETSIEDASHVGADADSATSVQVDETVDQTVSDDDVQDSIERLRHEVDHIVPDYSEGVMGPNTSIKPDPAPPASGSPGSAGGAAGVSRTVLVHVDVPPVT